MPHLVKKVIDDTLEERLSAMCSRKNYSYDAGEVRGAAASGSTHRAAPSAALGLCFLARSRSHALPRLPLSVRAADQGFVHYD